MQRNTKTDTEFFTKAGLNLAREYHGDNKLKRKDVRTTKRVDFKSNANHQNMNIMLNEPKMQVIHGG